MDDVVVFHNLLWPRYKGEIFSALHEQARARGLRLGFVQIARTDAERAALSAVDLSSHRYPFRLLFDGAYEAVPAVRRLRCLAAEVWRSPARLVVLPGYHRAEYWAMLGVCLLRGKRRAVFCDSTRHENPPRGAAGALKSAAKRLFFGLCDGFFAYGSRSAEYLREFGAAPAAVFQPCQAAALAPGFEAAEALARRVAARAGAAPRFLYVGRLAPEKGLDTLLRAFARARGGLPAGASLVLVGAGPERTQLLALAAELQLGASVVFAGAMDAAGLSAEYARASCLVLPSTREPWGLVVNEALHHGCPAIVSEVCGCRPDLVRDGVTGLAFDAGDTAALAQRLEQSLQAFADVATSGQACQRLMEQHTPAQAASRMLAGLERLLAGRRVEVAA